MVERLSMDLIERILDFVFAAPKAVAGHVWPVVDASLVDGRPHVRRLDRAFTIRPSFQFDASGGRLKGYWAPGTQWAERTFLCVDNLDVIYPSFKTLDAERVFWFSAGGEGQLLACSLSRDSIRTLVASNPTSDDRHNVLHTDPLGLHYAQGRRFLYRPANSRVNRRIDRRFHHAITVKHRIADFVYAANDDDAFWLTQSDHSHVCTAAARPRSRGTTKEDDDDDVLLKSCTKARPERLS